MQIADIKNNSTVLVGTYRTEKAQEEWILGINPVRHVILYNVRYNQDLFAARDGGIKSLSKPDYVLLYDYHDLKKTGHLFDCLSLSVVTEDEMRVLHYPEPDGSYVVYRLGEEVDSTFIDIETIINEQIAREPDHIEGAPFLISIEDVRRLIKSEPIVKLSDTCEKKDAVRFIDLFAGIGGIRLPFEELGYNCVFSSEWNEPATRTYEANFGEHPAGDITKIDAADIPAHDLLLAGFPCQAFSIMGKMKGFEDVRGTMFFEIARILKHHRPATILLENVKQLTTHDQGRTFATILDILAQLGYHVKWKVLNALNFGLPQKRERVIIVGFLDKQKCDAFNFDFPKLDYFLGSVLEPDNEVDKSLFASDQIIQKRQQRVEGKKVFYPSIWHENKAGNISVLDYACALRTGASYNYLLVNGVRRPSSRELLRLQGFPDSFKIVVPHSEIRKQTGNSVAVPMIRAVANKIDRLLINNI